MTVGVLTAQLNLAGVTSLKQKRSIVKSLVGRLKSRFNISIAEVGDNDLWQRAQLGMSLVGNDRQFVNSSLDRVVNFIEGMNVVDIAHSELELLNV